MAARTSAALCAKEQAKQSDGGPVCVETTGLE
jgi:hypothetical protein